MMRRVLRRALLALAILAALPVVGVALAFALANTDFGRAQLARLVGAVTAGTSAAVAIEGLHGRFPDDLGAARIVVSDPDGPWLTIEDAAISWSPTDLLHWRATIDAITAARVAVMRPPRSSAPAAEGGGLPLPVELRQLAIARLELPPGSAPAMAVALRGSARLDGTRMEARFEGEALDNVRGTYTAAAALDADRI